MRQYRVVDHKVYLRVNGIGCSQLVGRSRSDLYMVNRIPLAMRGGILQQKVSFEWLAVVGFWCNKVDRSNGAATALAIIQFDIGLPQFVCVRLQSIHAFIIYRSPRWTIRSIGRLIVRWQNVASIVLAFCINTDLQRNMNMLLEFFQRIWIRR